MRCGPVCLHIVEGWYISKVDLSQLDSVWQSRGHLLLCGVLPLPHNKSIQVCLQLLAGHAAVFSTNGKWHYIICKGSVCLTAGTAVQYNRLT